MDGSNDNDEVIEICTPRSDDGRFIACGWHGYTGQDCGCYHIDLLDAHGTPFATMAIEEGSIVEIAHKLLQFAADRAMARLYNSGTEGGKVH